MTPQQRIAEQHDKGNRECAVIILADPERHPGSMQDWALGARAASSVSDPQTRQMDARALAVSKFMN